MMKVPKFGTPLIATIYKGGNVEKSRAHIEQPLETTIDTTDKGLDNQSFFNTLALEPPSIKIPTEFIMQRMLKLE
jgi:hypothetical protein